MPTDRVTLQTLGEEIIATEGWGKFCRMVVGTEDSIVVVDGIRHVGAIDGLARLAGASCLAVVFVDAPEQARRARVAKRDGTTDAEFAAAEAHPNEREVPLVQQRSSLIVSNGTDDVDSLAVIIEHVVAELIRQGFTPSGE